MIKEKIPTGIIVYEGPSQIDRKPIVCIAIGIKRLSKNRKTGAMIQTYILRKNINPIKAGWGGQDVSICGDCKQRRSQGGACMVNFAKSPNNVWKAYKRGNYVKLNKQNVGLFKDKLIRCGYYGDPSAIPLWVWKKILKHSAGHTGYTHGWKKCNPNYKNFLMVSVDNPEEMRLAHSKGWRTFRIRTIEQQILKGEFSCPASEEMGKRLTCETCLACNGGSPPKGSVAIIAHGAFASRFTKLSISGETTWKN